MKHLIMLVVTAVVLGAVVGAAEYGLFYVFADALRYGRRPMALLLLLGGACGAGAAKWFENASGYSGLEVVAPLALVSAGAITATGYGLSAVTMNPLPGFTLFVFGTAAAAYGGAACVVHWREN